MDDVATLVALLVLARFALLIVRVDGTSMTPTYRDGERVLAVRRWLSPGLRRGSIVVLRHPPHVPVAGPQKPSWSAVIDPSRATKIAVGKARIAARSSVIPWPGGSG